MFQNWIISKLYREDLDREDVEHKLLKDAEDAKNEIEKMSIQLCLSAPCRKLSIRSIMLREGKGLLNNCQRVRNIFRDLFSIRRYTFVFEEKKNEKLGKTISVRKSINLDDLQYMIFLAMCYLNSKDSTLCSTITNHPLIPSYTYLND